MSLTYTTVFVLKDLALHGLLAEKGIGGGNLRLRLLLAPEEPDTEVPEEDD